MQKVNMHEAKIHLSRYVELAAGGEEILIARAESVARLVTLTAEQSQQRSLGLERHISRFLINLILSIKT